jgi:hypothetical protein
MSFEDKLPMCAGCRNDYYNHEGKRRGQSPNGCYSLPDAKVVTRFRLGWWTRPDTKGAFSRVTTLSCHYAPGRYSHFKELPDFVTEGERKRLEAE